MWSRHGGPASPLIASIETLNNLSRIRRPFQYDFVERLFLFDTAFERSEIADRLLVETFELLGITAANCASGRFEATGGVAAVATNVGFRLVEIDVVDCNLFSNYAHR